MAWSPNIIKDFFINLFTDKGAATLAVIWGVVMTILAHLTGSFDEYQPFLHGVVFFLFFFLAFILWLLIGWLWNIVSEKIMTKKATYVEYKVENGRLNLTAKSNIYKEPTCMLNVVIPTQVIKPNRAQRRAGKNMPVVVQKDGSRKMVSAFLIVVFEKPIHPSSFHLRLEPMGGTSPTKDSHGYDERYAHIGISNLTDDAAFRIRFN